MLHPKDFVWTIFICLHVFFILISCWPIHCLVACYLTSMYLLFFPDFFLWLLSSFIALWSKKLFGMTLIFLICWELFCDLMYNLFWRTVHVNWMYILFLHVHLNACSVLRWNILSISVRSIWSSMSSKASFLTDCFFCLNDLSIYVSVKVP